ncbi:hypothetical protein [Chelativorans xinjiangense]|nr:hypothetical protein [Chelativorans xinjiangense]
MTEGIARDLPERFQSKHDEPSTIPALLEIDLSRPARRDAGISKTANST